MVELGMIHEKKEEEDCLVFLEAQGRMEENIKTKQQFMKKGKNRNLLMDLWNILIGKKLGEILDKYALLVGKTKITIKILLFIQ